MTAQVEEWNGVGKEWNRMKGLKSLSILVYTYSHSPGSLTKIKGANNMDCTMISSPHALPSLIFIAIGVKG